MNKLFTGIRPRFSGALELMKMYVGVTDGNWFEYLSRIPRIDEINFWQPSGSRLFRILSPGEPFLFKLHSPKNFIVGGGYFTYSTILPSSLAWEAYDIKNGAQSLEEMRIRIMEYRKTAIDLREDFQIGCILLTQPFFFEESDWIPIPQDWSSNIVQGKHYDMDSEPGRSLWTEVKYRISMRKEADDISLHMSEQGVREGKEVLIKPRLGQGAFRVMVTDAYNRTCAVTNEKALPVLEAAHIKPFSQGGEHRLDNGILFRSDLHRLFDKGYMTITPGLHIEISKRIRDEFDNGEYYYTFHGKNMRPPSHIFHQPAKEFLTWHNENLFRG